MLTNTYLPNVCGVSRSVVAFTEALRRQGQQVLVVAPDVKDAPENEPGVVRVPALKNVTSNDICIRLPIPGYLTSTLHDFQPDVVHVHHPFLLGNTGLRLAASRNLPVLFTYHTMYEHYTHYIPGDSELLERFTVRLATEFANLCDRVIAPSGSVKSLLRSRGVRSPIAVLPTGIDTQRFARGDGRRARRSFGIPPRAFVVGSVGRLAQEKNLGFLTRAVATFLRQRPKAHFLVVGDGPMRDEIQQISRKAGVADRLHLSEGELSGQDLIDAYHAMDVMAFASHSETQGMVLAEAMAAGMPVVALDASGARDIVRDRFNGRLLPRENIGEFVEALMWVASAGPRRFESLQQGIQRTADEFSIDNCTRHLIHNYRAAIGNRRRQAADATVWSAVLRRIGEEYNIWSRVAHALTDAVRGDEKSTPHQAL